MLMNSGMLSTGRAARLCSVTADTVLKWIKKDQIQAVKTPGGHYRIDRKELVPYMGGASSEVELLVVESQTAITYCWQYHAGTGEIDDACRQCMVFRSKAVKCYLMSDLGRQGGHANTYCQKGCHECDYYKLVKEIPSNVLVITEDIALRDRLKEGVGSNLALKFSCCGYETAMVIQDFRPDFIIIDESLASSSSDEICRHLIDDPRVHGSQIVLASVAPPAEGRLPDGVCASIRLPFGAREFEECLGNLSDSFYGGRPVITD